MLRDSFLIISGAMIGIAVYEWLLRRASARLDEEHHVGDGAWTGRE